VHHNRPGDVGEFDGDGDNRDIPRLAMEQPAGPSVKRWLLKVNLTARQTVYARIALSRKRESRELGRVSLAPALAGRRGLDCMHYFTTSTAQGAKWTRRSVVPPMIRPRAANGP
jgi:hypothetical protein